MDKKQALKQSLHRSPETREQIRRELMEVYMPKRLRKTATEMLKSVPPSRPAYRALLEMRGRFDAEIMKEQVLKNDPQDPLQVAPVIAQWGHPNALCRRQATRISRECCLSGSSREVADRAARELRRCFPKDQEKHDADVSLGPVAYSITKAVRWPTQEEEIRLQISRGRARLHLFTIFESTDPTRTHAYTRS